jgi:hypothetical protein
MRVAFYLSTFKMFVQGITDKLDDALVKVDHQPIARSIRRVASVWVA